MDFLFMCSLNRSVTAFLIRVWWTCHYFFIWFLRMGKWILYSTLPNPILTQNFSAILSIDHMLMHGHKTLYTQIRKPRSKRGDPSPMFWPGGKKAPEINVKRKWYFEPEYTRKTRKFSVPEYCFHEIAGSSRNWSFPCRTIRPGWS